MNITLEKTGDLTSEISIQLLPEDYKGKVNEELKKHARKAAMPGFRQGKVPLGMVRKMVGKSVVIDEVTKAISNSLTEYIDEQNLNILGEPLPKVQMEEDDFDVNCESEVNFTFEVGLAPEFELNTGVSETPKRYEIVIDDEFLNKELESYQDRFADISNPEDVGKGDIIYGKLYEVDDKGEAIEEGFEKMIALNPDRVENKKIFKVFEGKKLEDFEDIDIFKLAKKNADVAEILFLEEDELKELKGKSFKFLLKRINRIQKAELNEEFFKKVADSLQWNDDEAIKDEKSFLDKMSEHLVSDMKESSSWYTRNEIQRLLIENHQLSFPDEFLKKWLLKSNEEYTEERIKEEYPDFQKSLTWTMIVGKVQEKYPDSKVEAEELKDNIKEYMRERYADMEEIQNEERLDDLVNYTLQNEEMARMHFKRVSDEKLYQKLEELISVADESINATDFLELIKKNEEK